jgi:aldose 1-epimerase
VLVHERRDGPDPYRYRATLLVALRPGLVRIALGVMNLADRALTYGFGLHPWFPAGADTRVAFGAAGALALGPGYRATGVTRWADGGPFAALRGLDRSTETALSLIDWDGTFRIETPSQHLAITLAAGLHWRHPLLWAPPAADFVCFEPQSHALGAPSEAIVRAVTPLASLAPGAGLWDTLTLTPTMI